MAVKASSQISILDITDAYSVTLTSEAYAFVGNTSGAPAGLSCSTQVIAYCGTTKCSKISVGTIQCPTGITASISGNGGDSPIITFKTTATVTAACEATIPVSVDGITINKKFSFAVAKQGGTGLKGEDGKNFNWNLSPLGELISYNNGTVTAYDKNSNTYTISSPTTTSSCGCGAQFNYKSKIPYGETYRGSIEVYIPITGCSVAIDINNNAPGGVVWAGNDNDLTSSRVYGSLRIPANTWTKVWWGSKNAHTGNTNKQGLNVYDGIGLTGHTSTVTWYIRNPKIELGDKVTDWCPSQADLKGETGKGVKSTAIAYQVSSSGTTIPTGTWNGAIPSVGAGQYLWTRTVITYTDNTTSTSYSVGRNGTNGTNGTNGQNGKSIGSVINYYLATSASSNVTTSTSGWTTTAQSVSASKKYLWNYEVIKYTDGTTASSTTPCIIGTYGDTGSPGSPGATGNGIKSITEHYAVSTSNTSAPTSWSNSVPTMTVTNKYLWNYETITYTNNSTVDTTKRVIGVYGNTGNTGKGIKSTVITYQAGASGTTAPTGTWSSTPPTTTAAASYLWTRTVITYTDNTTSTSYSIGATPEGITVGGRNLAQNTSDSYYVSYSSFTGADNVCFGIGNVLTKGLNIGDTISVRLLCRYTDIVAVSGKTAQVKIVGAGDITNWNDNGYFPFPNSNIKALSGSNGEVEIKYQTIITASHIKNAYWITMLRTDGIKSGRIQCRSFKVEKGNKHTDWTPAPEDTEAKLALKIDKNTLKSAIEAIADTINITARGGLNLTGNSFSVSSTNFTLTKSGDMWCESAIIENTSIKNCTITGGKINITSDTSGDSVITLKFNGFNNFQTADTLLYAGGMQFIGYGSDTARKNATGQTEILNEHILVETYGTSNSSEYYKNGYSGISPCIQVRHNIEDGFKVFSDGHVICKSLDIYGKEVNLPHPDYVNILHYGITKHPAMYTRNPVSFDWDGSWLRIYVDNTIVASWNQRGSYWT